jgi:hypothetical protein
MYNLCPQINIKIKICIRFDKLLSVIAKIYVLTYIQTSPNLCLSNGGIKLNVSFKTIYNHFKAERQSENIIMSNMFKVN